MALNRITGGKAGVLFPAIQPSNRGKRGTVPAPVQHEKPEPEL